MKTTFNLRSYLIFLSRNKAYTAINVIGFSISLMFVIIIGLYTQQELSVDSMHSKAPRIYSLGMKMNDGKGTYEAVDGCHWKIEKYLSSRYPEIEMMCSFSRQTAFLNNPTGERTVSEVLCADSTFYRMFDFPLVIGDRNHVLDNTNSAVISEKLAKQFFGDANPVGKMLTYNDSVKLVVSGVAGGMGGSSIKNVDVVMRFEQVKHFNSGLANDNLGNAAGSNVMLLAKPGANLAAKESDMTDYFKTFFWIYSMKGNDTKAVLTPLKKLYFSDTFATNTERGDMKMVKILAGVGIVILLFSIMNYISLTTAQASRRAREMATRRLLGSQRGGIMAHLILESVAMCFVSLLLGLAMSDLAAPAAAKLLGKELHFAQLFSPADLAVMIFLVAAIGVLSGLIPAFVISRPKPIDVVRGTFRLQSKQVLGRVFMTFQNVITIVMLASALTMALQTRHLINAPLGYDHENLMYLDAVSTDSVRNSTFSNELKKLPCVSLASFCKGHPLDRGNNMTMEYPSGNMSYQEFYGDKNYLKILGLKVEKQYNVATPYKLYVNKAAATGLGAKNGGRAIFFPGYGNETCPVAGLLADFKIGTITSYQNPIVVFIYDQIKRPWGYLVKVKGDPVEAHKSVMQLYKETFGIECPTEKPFVDQMIQSEFEDVVRLSNIMSLFAFIAVVISLMGLVAMSSFFIGQREREIAVRKVFGSTSGQICTKLVRTFLAYVLVAFVIAVPIIWHFMGDWLAAYSYRISLSWWIFAAAGAFCLLVSFVAVFFQSRSASNANPAKHLAADN